MRAYLYRFSLSLSVVSTLVTKHECVYRGLEYISNPYLFLADVLEGDPAGHRELQREGNPQEHLGAEAGVQTLPGGGGEGRGEALAAKG